MVALSLRNSHNKISINAAPRRSLSSLVHVSIVPDVALAVWHVGKVSPAAFSDRPAASAGHQPLHRGSAIDRPPDAAEYVKPYIKRQKTMLPMGPTKVCFSCRLRTEINGMGYLTESEMTQDRGSLSSPSEAKNEPQSEPKRYRGDRVFAQHILYRLNYFVCNFDDWSRALAAQRGRHLFQIRANAPNATTGFFY